MINWLTNIYNKKTWLVIAAVIFTIQLSIPAYMIYEQNQTLKHGALYKFKIRPIDPYDPFRGKYVVLSFDAEQNPVKFNQESVQLKRKDWVFAVLETDDDGFAQFSHLTTIKPNDNHYLRVKVGYFSSSLGYRINIPFDRYYSPEDKAYAIETNVRRRTRRNSEDKVYVAVKVLNGKGTIEDLYINGMPILKFVETIENVQQ